MPAAQQDDSRSLAAFSWRRLGEDQQPAAPSAAIMPGDRAGIRLAGEPKGALAVEAVDGERLKPPSPAFPSERPRYLDGGAFPTGQPPMRGEPKGEFICQRGAKMPSEARLSGCSFFSVWCCFLAGLFIGSNRAGSGDPPPPTAAAMQRRSSQRRQLCRGSINKPHRGIKNAAAYNAQNGQVHNSKAGDESERYRPDKDHENSEGGALNTMRCHYPAGPIPNASLNPAAVGCGARRKLSMAALLSALGGLKRGP